MGRSGFGGRGRKQGKNSYLSYSNIQRAVLWKEVSRFSGSSRISLTDGRAISKQVRPGGLAWKEICISFVLCLFTRYLCQVALEEAGEESGQS